VLIDGRYVDELRDMNLEFRGSSNQRVIDVQKSLRERKVILWKTNQ
ncbi:4Fe-4S cluster-binding domain-containing protein, partial [Anaerobutyricum hallii]|nr:4Fe-4S cluster-binding domain-containing protein [Anaerobutyricum hallii]